MLNERKITVTDNSVVNDEVVATYIAVIYPDKKDISFGERQINKEACMTHRNVVREDRATFEDFVYDMFESMKGE